jgi:hypothetical protein
VPKIMIAPSVLRAISAVIIGLIFFAITMSYTAGQARDDSTASGWSTQNVSTVLAELMPTSRPDPDFPDQDYIRHRPSNWAITSSREYAFSLIRRSNEGPGPLRYYWVAKVHVADSVPIFAQLERQHKLHPEETLAEIEPQV